MSEQAVRIATRGSKLALWQAEHVRDLLRLSDPDAEVVLVPIASTGDVVRDRPLYAVGGVGIFTKEIQQAVLDGQADIAVHSLKDLPTENDPRLVLAAVPPRASVHDVLIADDGMTIDRLPQGSSVATSSLRRRAQLLRRRPDLEVVDIRGNVETRIARRREHGYAGLILAEAGLERLGLTEVISERINLDVMLPAVGQGAIGIECRSEDRRVIDLLAGLDNPPTRAATTAERAFLRRLQGGCQVPIAAYAVIESGNIRLKGLVIAVDGSEWLEASLAGRDNGPERLGIALADQLLERGAARFIRPDARAGGPR